MHPIRVTAWGIFAVIALSFVGQAQDSADASFGTRNVLNDAEFAERQAQAARQLAADNADFDFDNPSIPFGQVGGGQSPPQHWFERGETQRQLSLIIDPPNGRLPALGSSRAEARVGPPCQRPGAAGVVHGFHALRAVHHARSRRLRNAGRLRQRKAKSTVVTAVFAAAARACEGATKETGDDKSSLDILQWRLRRTRSPAWMPMPTLHDTDAILAHLSRMRGSCVFARAGRMYPLLEYLVDAELAGDSARLNQYRIATDVLGRDERFDPTSDSIVRVEIGRLRNKLREYYELDGAEDRIRLELPKGGYRLRITVETSVPRAAVGGADGREMVHANTSATALSTAAASRVAPLRRGAQGTALAALAVIVLVGVGGVWLYYLQHDIAASVAEASSPTISIRRPTTASPEAYDLFLRIPTVSPTERIELLDRALAIDPDFAEAHAWKAYLLSYALINSAFGPALELPGEDLGQLVERHAREAMALDGDAPLAHVALGSLYLFTWRWTDARQAFERAAALAPNESRLLNYVYLDAFSGRYDEALSLVDRLIRNNPDNSTPLLSIRGLVLAMSGDFDRAAASLRDGISATRPMNEAQIQSMLVERSWLAATEIARGDTDAALRELRIIEKLNVETRDIELPFVAYAYARLGRDADARRLLAELEPAIATDTRFGEGASALVHLATGDPDRAHESLGMAARKATRYEPDEHFFALMLLRANPLADTVLDRPEFVDVLSRIAGD